MHQNKQATSDFQSQYTNHTACGEHPRRREGTNPSPRQSPAAARSVRGARLPSASSAPQSLSPSPPAHRRAAPCFSCLQRSIISRSIVSPTPDSNWRCNADTRVSARMSSSLDEEEDPIISFDSLFSISTSRSRESSSCFYPSRPLHAVTMSSSFLSLSSLFSFCSACTIPSSSAIFAESSFSSSF